MEWSILIVLLIINAALGGQQLLNKLARVSSDQASGDKASGKDQPQTPTSGMAEFSTAVVLAWWRELFKLAWSVVAVAVEAAKGRPWIEFWPGWASLLTVSICSFTGILENFGFYIISRYSPHLWVPYISVYLLLLPIFTGLMFGSTVRKEHWIGTLLVMGGLAVAALRLDALPQLAHTVMKSAGASHAGFAQVQHLDLQAYLWLLLINLCLCSQQILNNKSVQLATHKISANGFVVWREIFKFGFASLFLGGIAVFTTAGIAPYFKLNTAVVFALGAGLTGYIYSWGFFVLSKYPVHVWVPYTNLYVVAMPFLSVWLLAGVTVTTGQLLGTALVGAGLVVGLSDYSRHKIERITDKQ